MDERKTLLVTGISSGIGRAVALRLASAGWFVFGTVRRREDEESLKGLGLPNLSVLRGDLSRSGDLETLIAAVKTELASRGRELFALVNNAGGSMVGPIELMDLEAFKGELQTRLLGSLALVQAFLPALRRSKGRLIWIATPGTIPTPFVTGIHACDFAVNCIARTLAIELGREGPEVVMVRCGGIRTRAGLATNETLASGLAGVDAGRRRPYEAKLARWATSMTAFDRRRTEPELVAGTVERALEAPRPRSRYRVGHMSAAAAFLEALPQTWVDRILAART